MFNKIFRKIPLGSLPWVLCAILFCGAILLASYRIDATSTGMAIGTNTGTLVGRAVGSWEGLTQGQIKGYEDGKNEGLSAEDTTAKLSASIKEVQRLQVLAASGIYTDMITVGENKDYAALLSQKYNAIFTVDLSTAQIELTPEGLYILLDQPQVDFYPVGELTIVSEYQKHPFMGSAEDGHIAAMNSANKLIETAKQTLAGDASMMSSARISAADQLKRLVKAVSLSDPEVYIEWRENE